jgi:serine-type D-Ala-D-Ala carboxypeptidase (penicillin-binding protein 5/6)
MLKDFFTQRESEIRFLIFLSAGLAVIMFSSYILSSRVERGNNSTPSELAYTPFPEVKIQAKAAYIYDARTQEVLYAKNENQRMPLASLTKVMSALVAKELSPEYGTVTVSQEALKLTGDSGLKSGERWRLKDLLDFSLVTSSNDGMRAVALSLGALESSTASSDEILNDFVREMNRKAAELDLKNTYYWNETGLDETEYKGGAYGTAKDMAVLMEHIIIYYPEIMEATRLSRTSVSSLDEVHEAKNTNALAGQIPGLLASKTGFTNTAGGNLALAFDPELGRPIIVTILGSTEEGRFEDARILINAVLDYINHN